MPNAVYGITGALFTTASIALLIIYGSQAAQYNGMEQHMPIESFSWLSTIASSQCNENIDLENLDLSQLYSTKANAGLLTGLSIGLTVAYLAACWCHAAILRGNSDKCEIWSFVGLLFLAVVAGPGLAAATLGGLPNFRTDETNGALKNVLTCSKNQIWGNSLAICKSLSTSADNTHINGVTKNGCIEMASTFIKSSLIPESKQLADAMMLGVCFGSFIGLCMLASAVVGALNEDSKPEFTSEFTSAGPSSA